MGAREKKEKPVLDYPVRFSKTRRPRSQAGDIGDPSAIPFKVMLGIWGLTVKVSS